MNGYSYFEVVEHTVPGQHVREHPNALRTRQEDVVRLVVKQYVPVDRPEPVPENAVTVVGLHANGFPKETYEPYMTLLCKRLARKNICVRGVWIADCSNQGASGVLNERINGDMPSWFDHSRDLLHMINTFRKEMPRPIIGIAHSLGCAQLLNLALIHPRLLSTLIICEPVLFSNYKSIINPGALSVIRRDIWPSRAKAEFPLRRSFQSWHPDVIKQYLKHGLRSLPTSLYDVDPENPEAVTLTTTKHNEVWTYALLNLDPKDEETDRLIRPDQDPRLELNQVCVRPEAIITMRNLPFIRPSVLYVFGEKSPMSFPASIKEKMQATGTGVGGSGGANLGKVDSVIFPDAGHLLPFERAHLDRYSKVSAEWIERWYTGWLTDEQKIKDYGSRLSDGSRQRLSREYVAAVRRGVMSHRPGTDVNKGKEKL